MSEAAQAADGALDVGAIRRFGTHRNAFGFIRLLLASLVIVAHTPELRDGDRGRELLTRVFGTLSFGELAVDGFFVLSGFLIAGSFLKDPRPGRFLGRRVARIYPGFLLASLACLLLVAPLGGASLPLAFAEPARVLGRMVLLQQPEVAAAFAGTDQPYLDASMWTIAYEFRCYLLVLALGMLGLLHRPMVIGALAAALLLLSILSPSFLDGRLDPRGPWLHYLVGNIGYGVRLCGIFLTGSLFYLLRDRIRFDRMRVAMATVLLGVALCSHRLADAGVALFGGYILFALGAGPGDHWPTRINNRNDISYGIYLYAWPIAKLLLWYWPQMGLLALGAATLICSSFAGGLSWIVVERPVLEWLRRRQPGTAARRVASAT